MHWQLTVIDPNGKDVLFAGNSPDPDEIAECATKAKRLRPAAKVLVRNPVENVVEWLSREPG
jgi:hypothetical protein